MLTRIIPALSLLMSFPAAASTMVVDLVSPAVCVTRLNTLRLCNLPNFHIALPTFNTAVPLRNRVVITHQGNCGTSASVLASLLLDAKTNTGLTTRFSYKQPGHVVFSEPGGLPVTEITFTAPSNISQNAIYLPDCRITAEVFANEPAFDSKAQAEASVNTLVAERDNAQKLMNVYSDLTRLAKAVLFLNTLSQNLHNQLSNSEMQSLRQAAQESQATLLKVIALQNGCQLTDAEQTSLTKLWTSLSALGDPASWTHPDGTTKKLTDIMGSDGADIASVIALAEKHNSPGFWSKNYEQEFTHWTNEFVKAEAKLVLAKEQLKGWLSP